MLVASFATSSLAQSAEGAGGDSSPAMDQAAVPEFPQSPGDAPTAAAPVVVWCAVPDYGAQKIFVTPLRTAEPGAESRLRMLSLRFVRAVNAQQQADLDVNQKVCAGSATTRAASAAQTRLMAPLLAQGFVPVVIGVF